MMAASGISASARLRVPLAIEATVKIARGRYTRFSRPLPHTIVFMAWVVACEKKFQQIRPVST